MRCREKVAQVKRWIEERKEKIEVRREEGSDELKMERKRKEER